MLLIRLILLLLIAFFAYRVYQLMRRPRPVAGSEPRLGEDVVPCAECGLHVPKTQALAAGPPWFCSEEHRRRHEERASGA